MVPLLTPAHFEQILASLLTLLGNATTPKETYSASDRISRLASLHHKLYIAPEAAAAKEEAKRSKAKADTMTKPSLERVKNQPDEVILGEDKAYVPSAERPSLQPRVITQGEDQSEATITSNWFLNLPDSCLPPRVLHVDEFDPIHHGRIKDIGTITRQHYDLMQEAGMISADGYNLTKLAHQFFFGD